MSTKSLSEVGSKVRCYCGCRLYDVKNAAHKDKFGEEMLRVDSGTADSSGLTIQLG